MGKRIRKRTPEEQEIHDKIIQELLAGGSAKELAEKYSLKPSTVRAWKTKAAKKQAKALLSASSALQQYNETVGNLPQTLDKTGVLAVNNTAIQPQNSQTTEKTIENAPSLSVAQHEQLGDALKGLLLEQAFVPGATLALLRQEVGGSVANGHTGLAELIQQVTALIKEGKVDELTGDKERLSLSELATATRLLKDALKTFADLNLLPFGAQKAAPLKFSDAVPPQHLHLHSHGQRRQPKAIDADSALRPIKSEQPEQNDIKEENTAKHPKYDDLDDFQTILLDDL